MSRKRVLGALGAGLVLAACSPSAEKGPASAVAPVVSASARADLATAPPGERWLSREDAANVKLVRPAARHGYERAARIEAADEPDRVNVVAALVPPDVTVGETGALKIASMPDKVFMGKVDRIAQDRSTFRMSLQNVARLLSVGMTGALSIEHPGLPGLDVPRTAIVGGVVLVAQGSAPDGRARFVEKAVTVLDPGAGASVTVNGLSPIAEVVADASALR